MLLPQTSPQTPHKAIYKFGCNNKNQPALLDMLTIYQIWHLTVFYICGLSESYITYIMYSTLSTKVNMLQYVIIN